LARKNVVPETLTIWDSKYRTELLAWADRYAHATFFYQVARSFDYPVIIELGVREGTSTEAFLAGVVASKGELFSCDTDIPHVPSHWHSNPAWTFIQGDDLSKEVLSRMPQHADVLFIDTLHTYEHASQELENYGWRVSPGGVILMHDTELNEAVNPGCKRDDVYRAMVDYATERGLNWENHTANWGMGIIYKEPSR
jgi:predicted O-methyltransferase YrrM